MEIFPFKGNEDESTRVQAVPNTRGASVQERGRAVWLTSPRRHSDLPHRPPGVSPLRPGVSAAFCKRHRRETRCAPCLGGEPVQPGAGPAGLPGTLHWPGWARGPLPRTRFVSTQLNSTLRLRTDADALPEPGPRSHPSARRRRGAAANP